MSCPLAKPTLATGKLIDMAYICIKLVTLLPPLTCFDEIGGVQTMKVFWKCLNKPSIEASLTMKGDIFDHLGRDSFLSGKGGHLLEIAWKNGGTLCTLHGILQRQKNGKFLKLILVIKKTIFERK